MSYHTFGSPAIARISKTRGSGVKVKQASLPVQ